MGGQNHNTRISLVSGLLLSAIAAPAAAVDPVDKWNFWISGYLTKFDTDMRADGEDSAGTPVDLERDLDLEPSNILATIGGSWRPWERHQFSLSYYQNDSNATRQLQRDFVFEGQTYEADATVGLDFDSDIYSFQYVWWTALKENWALGPQFGLVWYRFKFGVSLELDVNGSDVSGTREGDVTANLPTPSLGFAWSWTPAEQWRISTEAGYFAINVDPIDARVLYGRVAAEWYPWERTGFRLDFVYNDIGADSERERFRGELNFLDSGLRLGVVYRIP